MGTGMVIVMVVMMGVMYFLHKDMMSHGSHGDHGAKTEESKTAPSKTDEGSKNQPEDHKHTH